MQFDKITFVVNAINDNSTNHQELVKTLIDNGAISLDDVYNALKHTTGRIINGVAIPKANYDIYVALVKAGEQIQAIKAIRSDTGLGLKDAKDIADKIRDTEK
jgi:ribosomal protein L7/L12